MKPTPNLKAEKYREQHPHYPLAKNENNGYFLVPYGTAPHIAFLRCIVSDGGGWDHVSVSLANRCPTWQEMSFVKDLFFKDEEVAMQLHVAKKDHINCHPNCLHLWRPQTDKEREPIIARYKERERQQIPEELRKQADELEMGPTPQPIPLPPGIMVAPH